MTKPQPLNVDQARVLADDLVRSLLTVYGQPDEVAAELRRWTNEVGASDMARVCMAVTQHVFAHCLTEVSVTDAKPGDITLERTPA